MLLLRLLPAAEQFVDREQGDRLVVGGIFFRHGGGAHAHEVLRPDLLTSFRVQELEVRCRLLAHAAPVDHLVDNGHRRLGQDRGRRVDDLEVVAKFLAHQLHLVFERHQGVADFALGEGGGGGAPAGVEHRHVLEDACHQVARLRFGAAFFQHRAPGGQVSVAAVAGGLRVGNHHLDAGLGQVVPGLDALRIAFADQEYHGRVVGRGVVREFLGPVLGDQAAVGQHVDVVGLVHRHHRRFEPVGHRARLLARAAVRLLDDDGVAGFFLVVGDEDRVDLLVQFARHVVGHVEQFDVGGAGGAGDEGQRQRTQDQGQGQLRGGGEHPAAWVERRSIGHRVLACAVLLI